MKALHGAWCMVHGVWCVVQISSALIIVVRLKQNQARIAAATSPLIAFFFNFFILFSCEIDLKVTTDQLLALAWTFLPL